MENRCLAKKGVSLVTVLIFMMVATIAATATYKWLSSAGFTSADRMAMTEAKEASHAGLESVRSWMTYHANDVGAIVRQYYDGGKKPVALTNVVRSMNAGKQVFNVWLTGVETTGSVYKFTIVSNGVSRGDAKYSETSVLNVRGLYKVREPAVVVHRPVQLRQSYFGGSTTNTGGVRNSSMIINGNWEGNPTGVQEDFVVTGNARLSGNNIELGENACIGGNMAPQNEGVHAGNIYVKGNTTNLTGTIRGNAVFDGPVRIANTGQLGMNFEGDLTLKSSLTPEKTKTTSIGHNFCVEKNGKLVIADDLQRTFTARGNVVARTNSLFSQTLSSSVSGYVTLGGNGRYIYMPNLSSCIGPDNPLRGCKSGRKYQEYNRFFKSDATALSTPTTAMYCDTSVIAYCNGILGKPASGCDGSKFRINDMITTAFDSFNQLVDRVSCANIRGDVNNFNMNRLNSCYRNTSSSPSLMYQGYLVVGVHPSNGNNSIFSSPTGTLDGNFIFVIRNHFNMLNFPPTTPQSNVFVYLENGAYMVNTTRDAGLHNYFFYAMQDIETLHNDSPGRNWDGTFYMTAENCARIRDMNTGNMILNFNASLMQNLVDNMVLCGYDQRGSCGALVGDGEEDVNHDGEELNADAGFDRYYVATAPQLSITLESQRRNKEILYDNLSSKEYTTVSPSIVILPRIIYLSDTPEGKLENYYKVINLNGARENFTAANTKCTPTLGTTGLITDGSPLADPVYKCEYTAKNSAYGKIPFWVVVDAQAAQKSAVSFVGTETRILGGGSVTVKMDVDGGQQEPVSAVVRVTDVPEGWDVTPSGSHVVVDRVLDDGSRLYTVNLQPGMERAVFQVSADANADVDQINFTILSTSENARIGDHPDHSVWLNGAATIRRVDIPLAGFCDGSKNHKTIGGVECNNVLSRPDCEGNLVMASAGEWVRPNCADIMTQDPNNQWGCGLSNTGGVKLEERSVSPFCDVFIPDSTIATLKDGDDITLYASYKAKLFELKVFLMGAVNSKVRVEYSKTTIDENTPSSAISTKDCVVGDTCRVPIFAGYDVHLKSKNVGDEKLHSWKFMRSDSTVDSVSTHEPMQVSLLHDTIVVADFRELENHCFYADFKDTRVWCDGTTNDCVDKCKEKGKDPSCNVKDGGNYVKSNWLISRPNKGVDFSEPDIQGGAIYYSPGKTSNNGKSSVTYLLNRTQTGGHGTLRAAFKSCDRKWNPQGKLNPLNSGFILRSNKSASSYAIVQIYAREGQTINAGKYVMETRVCQGDADGIKNENGAKCEKKEFGIVASLTELKEIVFNTEIEVVGDSAKVILSYKKGTSWKRSSVKLPLLESASIDEYVGLSLAEDCFKVMNLGWESDDWDAEYCFDIPKVGCSFAANYLGGILPLNEDVKPWVGTSSFFNDPSNPDKLRDECTIKYHYNGCDLPMDYSTQNCEAWLDGSLHCGSCRSADSEGPYYVSGINANTLKDDKYKFTYAGLHGTSKNYTYRGSTIFGAVRDASVVVDCSDADGANSYYEATCGRFTVGSINECSQSVSFNFDNCRNQKSCVVNVSGGLANLRSSVILGEIRGLPEDGSDFAIVSMVLKDANGLKSQEYQISGNGTFSRDVNLMSDMQEFDPEKVVSIEFSSANNFTLASLSSNCPNSVGVHDCTAELDGDHFMIVTSMVNANAATCKVEGNGNPYKADEKDCPQNGRIYVPAVDLQKSVNMSGSNNRVYSFTVTVKSKENGEEETCTTAPVEVAPNEMTCSLSSTTPVNAGESLPSLNYKITNCPPSGCTVEARIGTESPQKIVYRGNGQESSWSPDNINTTAGNYRYTLTYAGLSCTADITVITGANGSSADNCAIDEVNKLFTADLNLVMGSTNTLKLWYLDKLGNTVGSSKSVSPSTTRFSESLPEIAEAGDYVIVLSINGDTACTVPYTATGEEPTPDVDCYIEGGRFKTRNKNTTGQTMYGVYLNRSTDGSQNGNTVSTQNWAVDGYVDMEAYLPPEPGTYTYSLGYAGNTFCSVTYEVKDEESSEP